jgi:hypothetical protein
MKRHRRWLFNFALGTSLVMLPILAWGFCSRFGVMVQNNASNALPPFYRKTAIGLWEGRFILWIETWNSPPQGTIPAGRTIKRVGSVFDFRLPEARRAIGSFDAHFIRPPVTKGSVVLLIACPIWLLAAPFCVFPLLWVRKQRERRKRPRREIMGFPVGVADDSTPAYRPQ